MVSYCLFVKLHVLKLLVILGYFVGVGDYSRVEYQSEKKWYRRALVAVGL